MNDPKAIKRLDFTTLDTATFDTKWLVTNWIRRHDLCILSGEPGAAKSWLALSLATSVATGGDFASSFGPVHQGTVIYIDEDMERYDSSERFQALCRGSGRNPSTLTGAIDYWTENNFGLSEIVGRKKEIVAAHPALVIIDSMYCINPYDMNDIKHVRHVKAQLREVMREADCALVLIHHLRKRQAGQTHKDAEDILGSVGYRNMADAVIFMEWLDARKRSKGVKVRLEKQRGLDEETIEQQAFSFNLLYMGDKGTKLVVHNG